MGSHTGVLARAATGAAGLAAVILGSAEGLAAVPVAPAATSAAVQDVGDPCDPQVPAALDPYVPGAQPLPLRVGLLVDGVPAVRAAAIARSMTDSYRTIGIIAAVRVSKAPRLSGADGPALIEQLRPAHAAAGAGADITHLITARDLTFNGSTSLVGYADCIGGVAVPGRAISVSEVTAQLDGASLAYRYGKGRGDAAANVAVHEIGHLLGARHEHSDCASGAAPPPGPDPEAVPTPCSVMFLAAPTSGVFGPIEAAVARGYTSSYGVEPGAAG